MEKRVVKQIRLPEALKDKAERYCKDRDTTFSRLIRDYLKRLPDPGEPE